MAKIVEVTKRIRELGVPAHILGYGYIREAIMLTLDDPSMIRHITSELYPTIANKNETTKSSVERAIRHAVEVAYEKSEEMKEIFSAKPTNARFLATIIDDFRYMS